MAMQKQAIKYGAAAVALAAVIIAASLVYMGSGGGIPTGTSQSAQSVLVVQLTDPPHVPSQTSSLNMTYSSVALLVGEPTAAGQMVAQTVSTSPPGGSATLDLLTLQNVSETVASASLPSGSVVYSVTFGVQSIAIDVNGAISPVSLASGGTSFTVVIAGAGSLEGTSVALLQLNPIVVSTPSGYQMVPSAVGVVQHGHGEGEEIVGSQQRLNGEDQQALENATGKIATSLTALSASGNSTTVTVMVNNTGTVPVTVNAIGMHGNFTAVASQCQSHMSNSTEDHSPGNSSGGMDASPAMTGCEHPEHPDQAVFVPLGQPSTGSGRCAAGQMAMVNGDIENSTHGGMVLGAGQCVILTFTGQMAFGESGTVLVPSTADGQVYVVHVIASDGANEAVSCTLPAGPGSCQALPQQSEGD